MPNPITAELRAIIDETAQRAVRDERGPLIARIAEYIRNWDGTARDWFGERARLAADVEREFGVK